MCGNVPNWKHFSMTASDKRKQQWRDASRKRKQKIRTLKLESPKQYERIRTGLDRSKQKVYTNTVNSGQNDMKLKRYIRALNKFQKNRAVIMRRIKNTRKVSLNLACNSRQNLRDVWPTTWSNVFNYYETIWDLWWWFLGRPRNLYQL